MHTSMCLASVGTSRHLGNKEQALACHLTHLSHLENDELCRVMNFGSPVIQGCNNLFKLREKGSFRRFLLEIKIGWKCRRLKLVNT